MKLLKLLLGFSALLICHSIAAQQITYSETLKDDRKDISFEILGNVGGNYLIYKSIQNRSYITVYDQNMAVKENVRLNIPDTRLLNIDFITYPSRVLAIYQYQKGNIVYCHAAYYDSKAKLEGADRLIDTTKLRFFSDNKIYNVASSEDRSKILVYKGQRIEQDLHMLTKTYDPSLKLLDSVRTIFEYDNRRENYKDIKVSNDGTLVFLKETRRTFSDYSHKLSIFQRYMHSDTWLEKPIDLLNRKIDDSEFKIDNINKQYVLAAFAIYENSNYLNGLFTAIYPADTSRSGKISFSTFSDSLKSEASSTRSIKDAFDKYFIKDIMLKRDGSFLIVAEEQYTERRNSNWNRYNFNNPYAMQDYYSYYNWRYSRFYNPYYGNSSFRNEDLNFVNNIVIFSRKNDMQPDWNTIIQKNQSEVGTKNFMSYATFTTGNEIKFLFIPSDKNRQIVNNFGLQPSGAVNRYATLKSREKGYFFMPSFARQISRNGIIMPALIRNNISFAKIEF